MKANILTLIAMVFGVSLLVIRYAHETCTAMRIAGVILGLPSLVLLAVARIELGGSFSVRPKARKLVTHGLYARIRNPIYVFSALVIVAFFLYIQEPFGIFVLAVLIPVQMYRARQEEKVLEAKFEEEYRQYKARTWF